MRIDICHLAGGKEILAGTAEGRKLLAALIEAAPAAETPEALFLDASRISVMTASFLREAIVGFRDFARNTHTNLYPVIANPSPAVLEELQFFARQRNDVFWCCDLDAESRASRAVVVGDLDAAQRDTFELVVALGHASAPQLAADKRGSEVGVTAWNNRLSALASKGLLVARKEGKTKQFSPLLEVEHGR